MTFISKLYFFHPSAIVLLYHRVTDVHSDPHLLSVSISNFDRQMKYLSENYRIISLRTLIKELVGKKLIRNSVAITFDDGYADNLYNALPIINHYNLPVTIFVTAGMVGKQKPFYWDQDTNLKDRGRSLNKKELVKLSNFPNVEIGSHTMTHPHLSYLGKEAQKKEILESKKLLEKFLNCSVYSFSYPFGSRNDFTSETIELVCNAGYQYACSNIQERVYPNSDIFLLPRFLIRDWQISEFTKNLDKFL